MGDDGLSIAVIANPGWFIPSGGDFSYIEKALWKVPSQEFSTRKGHKLPISTLDAVLVIGNLVGSALTPEEESALQAARKKLDEELQRDRAGYHAQRITDLAGLVEELTHSPRAGNFADEIAVFKKLVGAKRGSDWLRFGEAKDRAVQRYEQLVIAAKAFERKYVQIPVYFAADTFLFEQIVPEPYWLHWRDLSFKTKLIKAFGNSNVKGIIPEYAINPIQRGKTAIDLDAFTAQLGHVTVANRLPAKLHEELLAAKGHTVVIGQRTTMDAPYPGNLVIRQEPGYVDILTFAEPAGVRAQYRWDILGKKFARVNEATIQNLKVTPVSGKEHARQAQLDQLRHIREMMDMETFMDQFAAQREQGYDTPEKLRKHIEDLEGGRDSVQKYRMRFEPFIDDLMKASSMVDWYISEQKKLEAEVASGAKTQLEADLARFDLVLAAVKQDVVRHKLESARAQEHNLAAIKELQEKAESRDTELAALNGITSSIEATLLGAATALGIPYRQGQPLAEGAQLLLTYARDQRENVVKLSAQIEQKDKTFQGEFEKKNSEISALQEQFGAAQDALVTHLVGMLKPLYDCYHARIGDDSEPIFGQDTLAAFDARFESIVGKDVVNFFAVLPAGASPEIQAPDIAKAIYEHFAELDAFARAALKQFAESHPVTVGQLSRERSAHANAQHKLGEERKALNEVRMEYSARIAAVRTEFEDRVKKRVEEVAGARIRGLEARVSGLERELDVARKQAVELPALELDKAKDEHTRSITGIRREHQDALHALRTEYDGKLDAMRKDYEDKLAAAEGVHRNGQAAAARQAYGAAFDALFTIAYELVAKGHYAEGVKAYTVLLQHAPEDDAERRVKLYRNRGVARINAKDAAGAFEDFSAALTLKPGDKTIVLYRTEAERIKVTTKK
jgi:hypothetical protein